ncbi:hypothetical protein B1H10_08030 [candidate division KSB1 bacterium 4484_188]|nr:MAG: hypothetical protein B1H10_08030 [candidate division KSB1 bacterium 4484_188]
MKIKGKNRIWQAGSQLEKLKVLSHDIKPDTGCRIFKPVTKSQWQVAVAAKDSNDHGPITIDGEAK